MASHFSFRIPVYWRERAEQARAMAFVRPAFLPPSRPGGERKGVGLGEKRPVENTQGSLGGCERDRVSTALMQW